MRDKIFTAFLPPLSDEYVCPIYKTMPPFTYIFPLKATQIANNLRQSIHVVGRFIIYTWWALLFFYRSIAWLPRFYAWPSRRALCSWLIKPIKKSSRSRSLFAWKRVSQTGCKAGTWRLVTSTFPNWVGMLAANLPSGTHRVKNQSSSRNLPTFNRK